MQTFDTLPDDSQLAHLTEEVKEPPSMPQRYSRDDQRLSLRPGVIPLWIAIVSLSIPLTIINVAAYKGSEGEMARYGFVIISWVVCIAFIVGIIAANTLIRSGGNYIEVTLRDRRLVLPRQEQAYEPDSIVSLVVYALPEKKRVLSILAREPEGGYSYRQVAVWQFRNRQIERLVREAAEVLGADVKYV